MKVTYAYISILLFNLLIIPSISFAKKTQISGIINLDDKYLIHITELFNRTQGDEYPLTSNGEFNVQFELSEPTWYEVTFSPIAKNQQLGATFPIFVKPGEKLNFKINYSKEEYLKVAPGYKKTDNNAFIDFSGFVNSTIRNSFMNSTAADANLDVYIAETDKLIKKYAVKNADIKEYLKIWAFNSYLTLFYASNRNGKLPKEVEESIPSVFNSPFVLSFYNGAMNVNNYVNGLIINERDPLNRLKIKSDKLKELFSNEQLIARVLDSDLNRFITSYRITDLSVFDKDVERLESLLEDLNNPHLGNRILNDLKNIRNTTIGSDFPDVKFKDLTGNEVSISQFKGKYIYIDLWASWCVPCIKEIPYLQALEKEFADKNIVFLSISLDDNKTAWKNKVNELNLHGHQWELGNSNYDKLMNVTGIPHFLLYGPDGKLMQYKAARPSSPELKSLFQKLL
ncbi:MAG: TlpA family protein disulfide reductase [Sphingobacterium composti]|uniref:TlpA family protein disulfide reductase n=1 Tax=Sphingobacterium composti TaxID=363260 RepID=UPI0013598203|nr:TlpA disulfide reductase family protein [Sphingobacterium composti Ten et al. 2007 non Yoo et al. 2007]